MSDALREAEARLVEARGSVRGLADRTVVPERLHHEHNNALDALVDAAIEVGRLRALAEFPSGPAYWSGSRWLTKYEGEHPSGRWVTAP